MSFTYINPGYAELLDSDTGTTVQSKVYNYIEGVSFWDKNVTSNIRLGSVPEDLYCKVSVFIRETSDLACAKIFAGNDVGVSIVNTSASGWRINISGGYSELRQYNSCNECNLHSGMNDILFHAKAGYSSRGLFCFIVNGQEVYNYNVTVDFDKSSSSTTPSSDVLLRSDNDKILLSNIIISDSEVAWNEKVAALPTTATDTNMMENEDGSYTATAAGQLFLQSLDSEALIDTYGEASAVTGLFLAGKPAYTTGSELTKAIACGRKAGVMTEYGTVTLKADTTAQAMVGSRLNMTLGDLRGQEFGWKAGV